ncbi:MAG TPA: hypothetical protein DD640_00585 [Clostridiales bacterium]|nr:hypothetical protein [Clostridiales bacterium]
MKAVVLVSPRHLAVQEVPKFELNPDQVMIRVESCGICGSDLRYFAGENPWALHTLGINAPNESNMILGHEFAGTVAEVGSPAFRDQLGKRVAVIPYNTCGKCEFCRSGRYNLCRSTLHIGHGAGWGKMDYYPGGMAEYCPVWQTHLCELPDAISSDDAAIIDPLSVAIHAISLVGIKPLDQILVLGSGPVGLCIAQAVRAYGADQVYCTDITGISLEIARQVGVDAALDARDEGLYENIMALTRGKGVNVVFDTVGSAVSQKLALSLLAVSGSLVNLVANETAVDFRLMDLSGERRIICSANSKYDDYLLGIRLMAKGLVKAGPLITHRFPIESTPQAFELLLNKEASGALKVVIHPN